MNKKNASDIVPSGLLDDIREYIVQARERTAAAVNSELAILYWKIGHRLRKDILKEKRADYGKQIVSGLARELTDSYGTGFSRRNLFKMVRFAEVFPDDRIVPTLSAQLSWSHLIEIISFSDPLEREFYAEMCRIERWSVRTLRVKNTK